MSRLITFLSKSQGESGLIEKKSATWIEYVITGKVASPSIALIPPNLLNSHLNL